MLVYDKAFRIFFRAHFQMVTLNFPFFFFKLFSSKGGHVWVAAAQWLVSQLES